MGKNKLMDMIGKLSEQQVEQLTGIALEYLELNAELIEADEAFVLESQKGVPATARKPRRHGESATKRGL